MMKGHVHLSKKDYSFFNNLSFIIKDRNQITSNQNKLFDKLIVKYQRQLRKLGHELINLQNLKWDIEVIETLDEYLHAKISIQDNEIHLRTPFNSKFLSSFRSEYDNTFIWDKDHRMYRSKFYTHALRLCIDACKKYFDDIEYCDKIKELLKPLEVYDNVSMAPTLVKENGKYYIKNSNKYLDDAIKHIELNGDAKTLYHLSAYGVFVSDDITNNDPFLKFASSFMATLDLDVLLKSPHYFSDLGITDVYYPMRQRLNLNTKQDKEVQNFCEANNIKTHTNKDSIPGTAVYLKRNIYSSRLDNAGVIKNRKIDKIIELTNSRPIDIK